MKVRLALASALAAILLVGAWFVLRPDRRPLGEPTPHSAPAVTADSQGGLAVHEPPVLAVAPSEARERIAVAEAGSLAPTQFVVRVLDFERRPLAGARVETNASTPPIAYETDVEGRARIPLASADGREVDLAIRAPGCAHVRATYPFSDEIVVVLARAIRLSGRVLEKGTQRALAGARVEYQRPNCKPCPAESVTADAAGRYVLEDVAVGEGGRFSVGAEGIPAQGFALPIDGTASTAQHDFVLDLGVLFAGVVVDFDTGAPVAGAVVESEGLERARTAADGSFETRVAAVFSSGRIDLRFGAEGRCWLRRVWTPEDLVANSPLRVPLPRAAFVEGRVRGESGQPVAGFELVVHKDAAAFHAAQARGDTGTLAELLRTWRIEEESYAIAYRTDAEGRFRTRGFVPHTPRVKIASDASAVGRVEESVGPLGAPGSTTRIELVPRREAHGTIAGRLLLNGAPVRGRISWKGPTRHGSTDSDAAGRFVLEFVEPGNVTVASYRDRYRPDALVNSTEVVALAAGQRVERDFDFVLETKPVTGRVVRLDGGKTEGLAVLFLGSPAGRHRQIANTTTGGAFALDLPDAAGPYTAVVYVEDRPFERDGIRAGDRDVEIVAHEMPTIRLRAIDAETREPIPIVDVYARSGGDVEYERVERAFRGSSVAPDGWLWPLLDAGTSDLVVRAARAGYAPSTRESVVVAPRGETVIELEMTRGATVEFKLTSGVAPWATHERVVLLEAELADALAKQGDASQRLGNPDPRFPGVPLEVEREVDLARSDVVTVTGLAPGRYRLFEPRSGLVLEPESIDVRAAERQSVVVSWRRK